MGERLSACLTAKRVLQRAESFRRRHSNDKNVGRTYGYFTHHPVAPLNRKRLTLLLEALLERSDQLKRPLRVLDLACGGGLITCAIASQGHRTLGLDLSAEEIHLAKLFAQEERLDGMFLQMNLIDDPTWEKTVEHTLGGKPDVITLAYALHHLPQVESFVERLSRWLDPGACLLVNEENPESPLFQLKHRIRTWIQHDTEVEWHRSFDGWKQLLENNRFRVRHEPIGADLLPVLGRVRPGKCWSLVFTAELG